MTVTWTLLAPGVLPPGVLEAKSDLAPDSPIDIGVPLYHTQADFLDLASRVLPQWYLDPLIAQSATAIGTTGSAGGGYELLQAFGKVFELASLAVGQFQCLATIAFSSGGQNALASVQFYRQSLASGSFTVKAGTIVKTSKTNRGYQVTTDFTFGPSDYFKNVLVQSLGQDSDYNVKGPIVTADGTVRPGEIDTVFRPILSPAYAEPALAVQQVADAYGGTAPALDQLGADRGIGRAAGELDPTYKRRTRALPDTVSPNALKRHLDAIFYQAGFHYDLIETWMNRYMSCWDAPTGGGSDPIFGALAQWAYDDPRTNQFVPRWMSEADHRSAIALVVPLSFPTLADRGMAYDDVNTLPRIGRAVSAWDAPPFDVPGVDLAGVWDGTDTVGQASRATFLQATWDILHAIKGGGVNVAMLQAEATQVLSGAPFP